MADGDGGALLQQHQRHRLADDVAAAYHYRVLAAKLVANRFEHLHAAVGRAGPEAGHAGHQRAGTGDVKTVHVLGRRDGFDHLLRVDVRRQRQLHQDAVNGRVGVQRGNARQQRRFAHIGVVLLEDRMQAAVFTGLDLVAHIDLGRRVFADQDHGQARCDATGLQCCGAKCDVGAQLARQGIAINEFCGHASFQVKKPA